MSRIERVIGIDVSLTSTGIAVVHRDLRAAADSIPSKGQRGDTIAQRAQRMRQIGNQVGDWLYGGTLNAGTPTVLTIVEAPVSVQHPGGSTWDRAGLWWDIVARALACGPVATVSPTTRAKWATGKGNADKAAVAAAMTRYAPQVEISNSDEADALALAYMGAQKLGWVIATGSVQYAAIDSVTWPERVAAEMERVA